MEPRKSYARADDIATLGDCREEVIESTKKRLIQAEPKTVLIIKKPNTRKSQDERIVVIIILKLIDTDLDA